MKSASCLLLGLCLIAGGSARPPVYLGYQDSLGQYSFGYSAPGSARSEVRTSDGATRGTYSYIDETGVIQVAQYVADAANGFRVTATNLPQAPLPVQETPEVMAARTAHLQALEMATRRDEEAHARGDAREDARERKIEGSRGSANVDTTQQQPEAKSADEPKAEGQDDGLENAGNVESQRENDETLQAIATKGNVDEEGTKNSQNIRVESSGRASQEILVGANIPAIPLISSQTLLPQALGQHAVPVFRISHGNHEIEPPAIPDLSIVQGASGAITPAATTERIVATSMTSKLQRERASAQIALSPQLADTLIAPPSVIPLSYAYSSLIGYASPASLHYVTYNVL